MKPINNKIGFHNQANGKKIKNKILHKIKKNIIFDIVPKRKAIAGVNPSNTSGTQIWKGTKDNLKSNPLKIKIKLII